MAGTDDPALGESTHSPGVRELLAEREFESIMSNRVIWVDYVVAKYDEVLAGLSEIRGMVEAELA